MMGCFCAVAQTPTWTQFPGSPAGTTRHDDICFVTETNGWTARGRDGIYKTTDGGKTWVQKLASTNTHFRSIGFLSSTRGFAGNLGPGSYDSGVTDTNLLYRTDDGGETWTVVPQINQTDMKGFCAMYVLDSQHIYGGGRVRGPAHFVKSEDGGNTWYVTNLTAAGVMGGIMDVYFRDTTNGFVVGMDTNAYNSCAAPYYHGAIARTTNGGLSWSVVANSGVNCSYFWKMSWPTPDIGYTSLQQNGTATSLIFFKTINGGVSWTSNAIPYSQIGISSFTLLQGIGFISANEGWVGGPSSTGVAFANTFLHTTNGGATWSPSGYDDTHSINRIRFYSKFAVASGAKLHIYRVPLSIATQPQSTTNSIGSSANFTVTAYGTAPLSYQWRFNGTNVANGNTNTYAVQPVQTNSAGSYDVVVSDYTGSLTSSVAVLTVEGVVLPPNIVEQPQNQITGIGGTATFVSSATGSQPLHFQWRCNGTNIVNATGATLVRTNVQIADSGDYSVIVTNAAGGATSGVATLTVVPENAFFFKDDFDGYSSPSAVTSAQTINGYKILFGAISGGQDFKAVFGYDYSTVNFPINIPPAPNSSGGTTKGLLLSVNKDATAAAAAVNLYPLATFTSNNFALKFDMWLNWTNVGSASEHALFGINHSGNITNRVQQNTSDGLLFAINSDGNVSATATAIRDYGVFRGGGAGVAPILMLPANTTFGPTPLLGPQFDNTNSGYVSLFPSKAIAGYPTTPVGSPGLGWVTVEVRQENSLITCLLNGVAIAQYTNTFGYTNGTVMIGYNDTFDSIGNTNSFVIYDNVRVERIFSLPIVLTAPRVVGSQLAFTISTDRYASYTVQRTTDLTTGNWLSFSNIVGTGSTIDVTLPLTMFDTNKTFFRVSRP